MDEKKDRTKEAKAVLVETIGDIASDAKTHHARARRQRLGHGWSRFVAAVLGVSTPALVTYQTQVDEPFFKIMAIVLAGIAGAAATLQATFAWGESYGRTRLTAFELQELARELKLDMMNADQLEPEGSYKKIRELIQRGSRRRQKILRAQVEGEVAIVTRNEPSKEKEEAGG